jgi:signal transduction histidine kinase/ActR/RegA family two-component response regulator
MSLTNYEKNELGPNGLCPVTGLPILQKSEWTDVDFGKDFRMTLRMVGSSILHSRPSGYATMHDAEHALELTAKVVAEAIGGGTPYVQIEDYLNLRSASFAGRRYFIDNMQKREQLKSLIFCGATPILKMGIKLGQRFSKVMTKVELVDEYAEAVKLAHEVLSENKASAVNFTEQIPTQLPVRSQKLITRDDWLVQLDGYTARYELIDDNIAHIISVGSLEEKHVPPLFEALDQLFIQMRLFGPPIYWVNDVIKLRGVTRKARKLFIASITKWYENHPFHALTFYGTDRLFRAAVNLTRPFVPFRVQLVKDLDSALRLISEEKDGNKEPVPRPEVAVISAPSSTADQTSQYIDELLYFIGNINWEADGHNDDFMERGSSHPLGPVFDAISLIKMDIDQLFHERKRTGEEKERLEAQLQQASKMEAIATLAGGVAHEFNNALMGIVGNIELLKMDLPEDERRDKYFERMKLSGHRMSRLTDQLLAYAQGGKYQPKNTKLDDFVIETLPILQHDLSPEVRLETHFQKDLSYIKADYAQMQMVLSAILANSNEAIEDEGFIRITANNEDVNEDLAKQYPGFKPGFYVSLTIEDDGKGMDEETRSGIFEPFFTTKFLGRGMGMAAVYGIVKNHGGWVYLNSEPGKGTVVQIYFPAIEIEVEKPKKAKVEVATGSGTILMIEDEDVVIEVVQVMLEMLGYRVMVAKTGKDAIHITETFDGQIDLALLDIKLPDMEGGKVYPLVMEARPNLKVIVFSGYSIDGPARAILDAGAQGFIHKPFSLATLSEKLKEVLGGGITHKISPISLKVGC